MSGEEVITRLRAVSPQLRGHTLIHVSTANGGIRVIDPDAGNYVFTFTPEMIAAMEKLELFAAAVNKATASMARVVERLEAERGNHENEP